MTQNQVVNQALLKQAVQHLFQAARCLGKVSETDPDYRELAADVAASAAIVHGFQVVTSTPDVEGGTL